MNPTRHEIDTPTEHDIDTLARTLYGESEVKDVADATAIASVVVNRVRWANWPNTAAGVCLQPWQFSCWNANDPQRPRLLAVTLSDPWFRECRRLAVLALEGNLPDPTNGATHYYASYAKRPAWHKHQTPSYTDPNGKFKHLFFNDIDTPPPTSAREALDQTHPLSRSGTVKGGQVATAATALAVGAQVAEAAGMTAQIGGALRQVIEQGPIVLGVLALAGVGYMLWRRYSDRLDGRA